MSKATPGPWFASSLRTAGPSPGSCICAETGENIGLVYRDGWDTPSDVARANARLIAAAPCLLEALEYVMSAHGEQLHDAFDRARAAIAKAEGRDP